MIYIALYFLILIIAISIYRKAESTSDEGRGFEDLFRRDLELISLGAKLRIILTQFKLFLFKELTIVISIALVLTSLILISWVATPRINLEVEDLKGLPAPVLITSGSVLDNIMLFNYSKILDIYRIYLDTPLVIKDQNFFIRSDSIIVVECYNKSLLEKFNSFFDIICGDRVLVLGRKTPERGFIYYENSRYEVSLESYMLPSNNTFISNLYSLEDLLDFRYTNIFNFIITPNAEIIISSSSNAYSLFRDLAKELTPTISVVEIKEIRSNADMRIRDNIEFLGNLMVRDNVDNIVIYTGSTVYILRLISVDIYQILVLIILYGIYVAMVMIIYLKAYRESYTRYSSSAMISGATDWIARRSILVSFMLYGLALSILSIVTSVFLYIFILKQEIPVLNTTILFFGSLTGVGISTIYLSRVLSEGAIYHVEKIPSKAYIEYELQGRNLEEVYMSIVNTIQSSEFFKVIEEHKIKTEGSLKALLRTIYAITIGVGIDLYIQIYYHDSDKLKIVTDIDPWSAEDIPREDLESVSRLMISILQALSESFPTKTS
ncbi:MAG: hypothetical protein QW366_04495 [Sulfolobales archaeon]